MFFVSLRRIYLNCKIFVFLIFYQDMLVEFPHQVRIENTNFCNAVCTMCPREMLTRPKGTMGLGFFNKIVAQLVKGGTKELHLQGYGEPFLDKTIIKKIKAAKAAGMPYTFMVTNASLLTDKVCRELLTSGLDKLKISFYGVEKESYEKIHNGLKFEEVKANLQRLLRIRKEIKKSGKPVTKIDVKYIGRLRDFVRFAFQWGFKAHISFARMHNYGYGRGFNKAEKEKSERKCSMVIDPVMQVLWDGLVVPCCYDFDGKMILGDLNKETVAEVWKGEKYTRFRGLHQRGEYEKLPICNNCDKLR